MAWTKINLLKTCGLWKAVRRLTWQPRPVDVYSSSQFLRYSFYCYDTTFIRSFVYSSLAISLSLADLWPISIYSLCAVRLLLHLITLSDTHTIGRTPQVERSARRRGIYLTTNNTHKMETTMSRSGFEPAIPASERPQTHVLDRAATVVRPHWSVIKQSKPCGIKMW
jgi:hypothetical protein